MAGAAAADDGGRTTMQVGGVSVSAKMDPPLDLISVVVDNPEGSNDKNDPDARATLASPLLGIGAIGGAPPHHHPCRDPSLTATTTTPLLITATATIPSPHHGHRHHPLLRSPSTHAPLAADE